MGLIVAAVIGLWNMKKWGAYLYTANFALNVVWVILAGGNGFLALILPIVLLFFIYNKISLME